MNSMRKPLVIAGVGLVLALIAAAIIPLWVMTAHVSLPPVAIAMIVLMVIGCFAVGGGLMFLVFYSARKGYDDAVDHRASWRDPGEG
jgi:hypothetical protein